MLERTTGSLCGCALVCSSGLVRADHHSTVLGVGRAQPVTTISAIPMPAGSLGVGMRSEYINNDDFSDAPGSWDLSLAGGVPVSKFYDRIQSEPSWRVIGSVGLAMVNHGVHYRSRR